MTQKWLAVVLLAVCGIGAFLISLSFDSPSAAVGAVPVSIVLALPIAIGTWRKAGSGTAEDPDH